VPVVERRHEITDIRLLARCSAAFAPPTADRAAPGRGGLDDAQHTRLATPVDPKGWSVYGVRCDGPAPEESFLFAPRI
jgi:hypothetical protein